MFSSTLYRTENYLMQNEGTNVNNYICNIVYFFDILEIWMSDNICSPSIPRFY